MVSTSDQGKPSYFGFNWDPTLQVLNQLIFGQNAPNGSKSGVGTGTQPVPCWWRRGCSCSSGPITCHIKSKNVFSRSGYKKQLNAVLIWLDEFQYDLILVHFSRYLQVIKHRHPVRLMNYLEGYNIKCVYYLSFSIVCCFCPAPCSPWKHL